MARKSPKQIRAEVLAEAQATPTVKVAVALLKPGMILVDKRWHGAQYRVDSVNEDTHGLLATERKLWASRGLPTDPSMVFYATRIDDQLPEAKLEVGRSVANIISPNTYADSVREVAVSSLPAGWME